jgi:hypothetical protein
MTVTMIKRRRDDLTLHLTGLVHARALFDARGATPEDMDTLDHETERIRSELARLSCKAAAYEARRTGAPRRGHAPRAARLASCPAVASAASLRRALW